MRRPAGHRGAQENLNTRDRRRIHRDRRLDHQHAGAGAAGQLDRKPLDTRSNRVRTDDQQRCRWRHVHGARRPAITPTARRHAVHCADLRREHRDHNSAWPITDTPCRFSQDACVSRSVPSERIQVVEQLVRSSIARVPSPGRTALRPAEMLAPGYTPACRPSRVSAAQPPISVSRRPGSCGTRVRRRHPPRSPRPHPDLQPAARGCRASAVRAALPRPSSTLRAWPGRFPTTRFPRHNRDPRCPTMRPAGRPDARVSAGRIKCAEFLAPTADYFPHPTCCTLDSGSRARSPRWGAVGTMARLPGPSAALRPVPAPRAVLRRPPTHRVLAASRRATAARQLPTSAAGAPPIPPDPPGS